MRFRIINNNGTERFVQAKSKAAGKIKGFERLSFDSITPDSILKVADAQE